MTEPQYPIIPGAETPDGRERIRLGYEAFRVLRQIREEGLVNLEDFTKVYARDFDKDKAREFAKEAIEEIDDILRRRTLSDTKVLNTLAGNPE